MSSTVRSPWLTSRISEVAGRRPRSANLEGWVAKATQHPGSWWPDWFAWLTKRPSPQVPARVPGDGALKPIEDAPGSYVKVQA